LVRPASGALLKFAGLRENLRKSLQIQPFFAIFHRLTARALTTKIAILQGQFRGQ
jgi:hypothetical protein